MAGTANVGVGRRGSDPAGCLVSTAAAAGAALVAVGAMGGWVFVAAADGDTFVVLGAATAVAFLAGKILGAAGAQAASKPSAIIGILKRSKVFTAASNGSYSDLKPTSAGTIEPFVLTPLS